jgi:glyoxalase family protein
MHPSISGIHHVTAIGGEAQQNVDFYTGVLGLRLVKTTVNFDDPTTYHLYYGDETGRPGTALTFFPWARAVQGRTGAGMASAVAFAVPEGTGGGWRDRLTEAGVDVGTAERFGEEVLQFEAPDGLPLEIVPDPALDDTATDRVWTDGPVSPATAIRGFFGTTLPALNLSQTTKLFTDLFGWAVEEESSTRIRLRAPSPDEEDSADGEADAAPVGRVVDLQARPTDSAGRMGKGTVHHVAFRARDEEEQAHWQEALRERGLRVTDVKDRDYFRSIYFRDADWTSGVLFEIATDGPGFLIDETKETLGTSLQLPSWLEARREELEDQLPPLTRPNPTTA